MGKVSNLRVVESLGSTVRLGWTGVAGATQYRILILNTEGQHASSTDSPIPLWTRMNTNTRLNIRVKVFCVSYGVSGYRGNPDHPWRPDDA